MMCPVGRAPTVCSLPRITRGSFALLVIVCWAGSVPAHAQSDSVALRQIVIASEEEALQVRQLVAEGRPFDAVAAERSLDVISASRGGYLGRLPATDLRAEFQNAVAVLSPGEVSVPVVIGDIWYLFQLVSEVEAQWIDLDEAGAAALERAQNDRAAGFFEEALRLAETYAPDSLQLVRSLDGLATVYRLLDRPVEADALYRRALNGLEALDASDLDVAQILNGLGMSLFAQGRNEEAEQVYVDARGLREAVLGPDHPEVAAILLNQADLQAAAGKLIEAAAMYEQSQSMLVASLGPDHPATLASETRRNNFGQLLVPALLDRFSTIVSLAEFKDSDFERTVREVHELLPLAPLTERSYVQMKDILLDVGLSEETEAVLRMGLEKFPDSRILRIYLADLLAGTGRTQDALGHLEEAGALPRPEGLDEPTDRQQQGIIHQRIGDIQSALTNFDEAVAAYLLSLEIDSTSPGGRGKLGKAYFSINRIEDALREYERAAAENPEDPEAHLNLAEGHLAGGDWMSAEAAAARAIDLGTADSRALYLLGTALVRQGRRDEGMEHLREFQSVETAFLDLEHENREVDAISLAAISALRQGNPEEAVESLVEGIRLYPNVARLHMNLAMVQNRMEQHRAAAETYERMLESGIGRTFLVHRNLADEYETLGNIEASQRHRQTYIETRDTELIVYAPE